MFLTHHAGILLSYPGVGFLSSALVPWPNVIPTPNYFLMTTTTTTTTQLNKLPLSTIILEKTTDNTNVF